MIMQGIILIAQALVMGFKAGIFYLCRTPLFFSIFILCIVTVLRSRVDMNWQEDKWFILGYVIVGICLFLHIAAFIFGVDSNPATKWFCIEW